MVFQHVSLDNDTQLVAAVRQYKKLRTYRDARDAHQRDLHARMVALAAKGAVKLAAEDANTCVWTT